MQLTYIKVHKWSKKGPKTSNIANVSWYLASGWVWHAAYVHPQHHVTCPMSHKGPSVRICNLACIGDAPSLHTSPQVGKKWELSLKMAHFGTFLCVARPMCIPQRNVTHTMSRIEPNVIRCNLDCIDDATSLHTSAQIVQKGPRNPQHREDFMVCCLILCLARSLCASPTPCNLSNATTRTDCDNIQLDVHWGCNKPTYKCSTAPKMAQKPPKLRNLHGCLPQLEFGTWPMCNSNPM